jgi:hypothetical protein
MLIDVEKRHADNPDTFEIPSREERESLRVWDFARLIFAPGERIWVEVVKVGAEGVMKPGFAAYIGAIRNRPIAVTLQYGDWIGFDPRHICEVKRR